MVRDPVATRPGLRVVGPGVALLAAAVIAGCSRGDRTAGAGPDRLGVQHSAVIGGETVTSSANPNQVAFYRSDGSTWIPRPCTATALSEDWVLTARHCTRYPGTTNDIPVELMAITDDLSPGISGPPSGYHVPTVVIRELDTGPDVALLKVTTTANLGSLLSDTNLVRLYKGTLGDLQSAAVECYGYGRSVCSDPSSTEDPSYGAGTLRQAGFGIDSVDLTYGKYTLSSSLSSLWSGDSGGACYLFGLDGVQYLTGVHSTGTCDPLYPGEPEDSAIPISLNWVEWNTENVPQAAIISALSLPLR